MSVSAGFETGVNGSNIATTDTGNATAWDTVTLAGATGTGPAYDNAHAHSGSLAAKLTTGASSSAPDLRWSTAFGTQTDHYGRLYLWTAAFPTGEHGFIPILNGGSTVAALRMNTSGQIVMRNAANTTIATFTNAISLSQWVRIEWHLIHGSGAVGTFEVKLFNSPDSTTATETQTITSVDIGTQATLIVFAIGNISNCSLWYDDIVAAAGAYPGPTAAAFVPKIPRYIVT